MRIAYFGGTFDPPHLGHLAVAHAAQQALHLEAVLFAPVGVQALKPEGATASFEDRVAMTRLAIAGEPRFRLSLADAPHPERPRPNYTAETLTGLAESLDPGTELFLLMGADSLRDLKRWHRAAEIPFLANLIVASRPGEDISDPGASLPAGILTLAIPNHPNEYVMSNAAGQEAHLTVLPDLAYAISASEIRQEVQRLDRDETRLIPDAVMAYIHEHGLYREKR